ncbi:MAG: D-alanine--D-alanine ligase family protein [Bacteroidota bacterium]
MTHIGLIYGGQSSEHEVSVRSARNVFAALRPERYRVTPVRIDRTGRWHLETADSAALHSAAGQAATAPAGTDGVLALAALDLDVALPMLHGQNGEDGRVQGFLQTLGIPYVGAGVLASAACMDKEVTKRILRDAGLPIVPFRLAHPGDRPTFEVATADLGPVLFVKPANSGSSVGTARAEDEAGYEQALDEAFGYDRKVLVEAAIAGREIECAVLGNEEPRVAVPGEIVSTAAFYTYDAKYEDPDASRMEVPADLPEEVAERVRGLAVEAYRALGCEGMSRVDFFLTPGYDVFVNEINTIPGFTERSMFPVMWKHSGLPIEDLLDTLVDLALDRHERDARFKTTR